MTEAWDALVGWAQHSRAAGRSSMTAEVAAILQGQAEIERLRRELAATESERDIARKSTEEALELVGMGLRNREVILDELESVKRELAELKPAAPAAIVMSRRPRDLERIDRLIDTNGDVLDMDAWFRIAADLGHPEIAGNPAAPGESGEAADG